MCSELLKVGDKVYSLLHGEDCEVISIFCDKIHLKTTSGDQFSVFSNGEYFEGGECIIFPNKGSRTWEYYKKFDPNTLEPFDRLLVRDSDSERWSVDWFSYIDEFGDIVTSSDNRWEQIIPYNEETKNLIGTTQNPPKYYE